TIEVELIDPREFTSDRHRTVDDAPYGGGPGMVMKPEPLIDAIEAAATRGAERGWPEPRRMLMSPAGAPLTQVRVRELAGGGHLVLVCGRYEGIDQRVVDLCIDEEVSLGDFVLTGGELAAMAIVDAVARYVPGVLGDATSTEEESFSQPLLEYPQYTRPAEYRERRVPETLMSGDHARIGRWRRQEALRRTAERRPDLLAEHVIDDEERKLLRSSGADWAARTYVVLAHHPVFDKAGEVVTSSITNMDLHDLARTTTTYGLAGYIVVTPVGSQRDKVDRVVATWREGQFVDNREQALSAVTTAASLDDAYRWISETEGAEPVVVATSARRDEDREPVGFAELARARAADPRPTCLIFGTGWGLTEEVLARADELLRPVSGRPEFNHLCVRSAAAIVIDRLFGVRGAHG
ncbi:MAG: tRNA (guanosine(37)-N1)-methyltransferase TrmD, partial [Deltaproteobacteria bacterium]|nr:tRNA (guanosine(37)-N1)-methyltransferase TrmD [Deltaproteobacteria bacterium]